MFLAYWNHIDPFRTQSVKLYRGKNTGKETLWEDNSMPRTFKLNKKCNIYYFIIKLSVNETIFIHIVQRSYLHDIQTHMLKSHLKGHVAKIDNEKIKKFA